MIDPAIFAEALRGYGITFFAGVPDSLLKDFCSYADDTFRRGEYIITANEGNAIALASGYHLATGKIGAVYMQNSGLGNAVNPLTSLTDPEVYRIPLLLIIGWRGEPGVKDEPQHVKQGQFTPALLDTLGIPFWVVDAGSNLDSLLKDLFGTLERTNAPAALLIRKGTFAAYNKRIKSDSGNPLGREEALRQILSLATPQDLFISTTGKTSRELYELRVERNEPPSDFLTVGSMGHTSSIALGVALGNPSRRVICLDGDGSLLMHMGAMAIIGTLKPANLVHVLLNNASHESVGGQATVAGGMNFSAIAKACGYREYLLATDSDSLASSWQVVNDAVGPVLLEVRIRIGSRKDLGRPKSTPEQNKSVFIEKARN